QPLVDVDYARQGAGEVTFSLTEGRFSDGRCGISGRLWGLRDLRLQEGRLTPPPACSAAG
ncbi:hypothetical protein CKF46_35240, partial [Klebsiella pneumoniae]